MSGQPGAAASGACLMHLLDVSGNRFRLIAIQRFFSALRGSQIAGIFYWQLQATLTIWPGAASFDVVLLAAFAAESNPERDLHPAKG